jgi:hypothetical protein
MNDEQQASFNGWAKVEVMGHQSHIGFVKTEAYGAAVLFRIDTPDLPEREFVLTEPTWTSLGTDGADGRQWTPAGAKVKRVARPGCSVLVGAGSIYRIIPCTEEAALRAIDASQRAELRLVEVPKGMALPAPEEADDFEEDDGDDYEEDLDDKDEVEASRF